MIDFENAFSEERAIFLEKVNFELSDGNFFSEADLYFSDSIDVYVLEEDVIKVVFTRDLHFEPEGPFTLSVSFGELFTVKPEYVKTVDWLNTDIANELSANPSVLEDIVSRTSLLISQITSSYGQPPIVSSPVLFRDEPVLN